MTTKTAVLCGGLEDVRAGEIFKNTVIDMSVSFYKYKCYIRM